jgi:hypothetical protein
MSQVGAPNEFLGQKSSLHWITVLRYVRENEPVAVQEVYENFSSKASREVVDGILSSLVLKRDICVTVGKCRVTGLVCNVVSIPEKDGKVTRRYEEATSS